MHAKRLATLIITATCSATSADVQGTRTVPATANIYQSGGNNASNVGTNAVSIQLPPTANEVVFSAISGVIRFAPGFPEFGPDGRGSTCDDFPDVGGIAGLDGVLRGRVLLGVFLTTSAPTAPPPPRIDLAGDPAFASVAPAIAQTFYIGDGRIGLEDPDAPQQVFHVPAGASHLYLGLYDANGCGSPPANYGDNSGTFTAEYIIHADPCGIADLAEPCGLLDLADVTFFLNAFLNSDPAADLAPPTGLFDLADIVAFVTAFNTGCS